ncbi:hypothetical protein [Dyella thiooxydans]|uniref:hypothetical protein n=1 Tax=Dyella thiooxydans TaxID=445710 RepID=UPI000AE4641A|nr:hypothetical protein [Dyella thiooxydans]
MTDDPLFGWTDDALPEIGAQGLDHWKIWKIVDPLGIREAARLLAGLNPKPSTNRIDSDKAKAASADAYEIALIRAVQSGRVRAANPLAWEANGYDQWTVPCDSASDELCSDTTVHVADLVQWATACGIPHGWPAGASEQSARKPDLSRFPEELRAAIEAFDAVRNDPKATAGKSAKQALETWLEANKPELTGNARERIASVANWQRAGGAPKTPGE